MKILSITAQKPNSTGSGVYLTELVRVLRREGHAQRVIAGVYQDDAVTFPDGVGFDPVFFNTDQLPFPIVGMSDDMPYPSTRYCDMTEEMVQCFASSFLAVLKRTLRDFKPDLIMCHHLYLLTALVREAVTDVPVYGFCHNTDLRQMKKHGLERERIRAAIQKLDRIFVLRSDQAEDVVSVYNAPLSRITAIGMGYNREIFYPESSNKVSGKSGTLQGISPAAGDSGGGGHEDAMRLIFAGKITQKKGVMSLIRALNLLDTPPAPSGGISLTCAGGSGNEEEYRQILELARHSRYSVYFPGRLSQEILAGLYRKSDIFILPSFCEGIPLTVVEALACGCRVVVSDLPGIKEWLDEFVSGADIRYVPLPRLINTDEPVEEDLPGFEKRLSDAIRGSLLSERQPPADVSRISWEKIVRIILP